MGEIFENIAAILPALGWIIAWLAPTVAAGATLAWLTDD